jgi:hypothetical protein
MNDYTRISSEALSWALLRAELKARKGDAAAAARAAEIRQEMTRRAI